MASVWLRLTVVWVWLAQRVGESEPVGDGNGAVGDGLPVLPGVGDPDVGVADGDVGDVGAGLGGVLWGCDGADGRAGAGWCEWPWLVGAA